MYNIIAFQAILPCDSDRDISCLNTRFFMPSVWGWENRAGWYRYTVSLARLPTGGELGRLRWRKLNGETLSLDNIYVGQECSNRCTLHGDCRVCPSVHMHIGICISIHYFIIFYYRMEYACVMMVMKEKTAVSLKTKKM